MSTCDIDFDLVDPRHIDAEFPSFEEYVLGDISPTEKSEQEELCASFEDYENAVTPIPSNEWVEISRETEAQKAGNEWLMSRIMSQGREGSCVYNQLAQQLEVGQAKMFGKDNVILLSPISGYQDMGRSPSSGSTVNGSMDYAKTKGLCPLDNAKNRELFGDAVMPHTGFYTRKPAGAYEAAANFKAHETYVIRTYEGLVTALLRGDTVGVGREGHSIMYIRVAFKNDNVNSIMFIYPNSWDLSWGFACGPFKGGFGADTMRQGQKSAGWAFVVASMVDPSFRHKAA